jgi:predicted nucleic acid-binding protein
MNVLIDTNIAIDVLIQREPFYEQSQLILLASEKKLISGFISATTITDIFFIINKTIKNKDISKNLLKKLVFDTVEVAAVDKSIITQALKSSWDDFEDCVQYYVGESIYADYIVTRNPDDFTNENIIVLSPEELLDIIAPE